MSEPAWVPLGPAVQAAIPLVTALPGSPVDGDEIIFTDSLSAGTYHWHLRYVAARGTNKWVFVGGAPALSFVDANESSSSTSYVALATAGPSFTVPVAGDYMVEIGAEINTSATAMAARMSFDVGATPASDTDSVIAFFNAATGMSAGVGTTRRKTGLAAATALVAKYKASAGTGSYKTRWMRVVPIAVGG